VIDESSPDVLCCAGIMHAIAVSSLAAISLHSFFRHARSTAVRHSAIKRHRAEYDQLQNRIDAMYVHMLDGRVDAAFFERISNRVAHRAVTLPTRNRPASAIVHDFSNRT